MDEGTAGVMDTREPGAVPPAFIEEESSIDVVELLQKLRCEKRIILVSSVGLGILVALCSFLLPTLYTSSTSFVPPTVTGGSSAASLVAGQLSALGAGNILGSAKDPGDLYAGILRSRSIAEQLIKRFNLMKVYKVKKESKAEIKLASHTDVSVDPKSSIVTLEVSAKSPQLAHDLASAYMDALHETNGRLALGQSSQRALFFGQQLAKEKDDLEDAEVALKQTQEQSGLIEPSGQTASEIKTIAETQAEIAARQVELAALRLSSTEQNPDVIRLQSEIADLQGQLARIQRGGADEPTLAIPTSKVPEVQLEFVRKKREVMYHETLFDMLSRQYEAARLDEARDAPVLQVLDPASYPDTKSSPKRSYYLLGGFLAGLIGSSIWIIARDWIQLFRQQLAEQQHD